MVDELNEMGYGRYNKWGVGKMMLNINTIEAECTNSNKMMKQDGCP